MNTVKKIKDYIDSLEKDDFIESLELHVNEIDDDSFILMDLDFEQETLTYEELFEKIVDHYLDESFNI